MSETNYGLILDLDRTLIDTNRLSHDLLSSLLEKGQISSEAIKTIRRDINRPNTSLSLMDYLSEMADGPIYHEALNSYLELDTNYDFEAKSVVSGLARATLILSSGDYRWQTMKVGKSDTAQDYPYEVTSKNKGRYLRDRLVEDGDGYRIEGYFEAENEEGYDGFVVADDKLVNLQPIMGRYGFEPVLIRRPGETKYQPTAKEIRDARAIGRLTVVESLEEMSHLDIWNLQNR